MSISRTVQIQRHDKILAELFGQYRQGALDVILHRIHRYAELLGYVVVLHILETAHFKHPSGVFGQFAYSLGKHPFEFVFEQRAERMALVGNRSDIFERRTVGR